MTGTESIGLVSAALLLMTAGTAATVFSRRRKNG
jgi:LPXTG-motif cell wall-anchored protein